MDDVERQNPCASGKIKAVRRWLLLLFLLSFGCFRGGFKATDDGSLDLSVSDAPAIPGDTVPSDNSPTDASPTSDGDYAVPNGDSGEPGGDSGEPGGDSTANDVSIDLPPETCAGQPDGTPCDDQNICTSTSTCQGGVCKSATNPTSCTVADSENDFGGVQGGLGWYYGYWHGEIDPDGTYNPFSDFEQMVYKSAGQNWEPADADVNPTWCYLAPYWEHPGSNPLKVPVRRWVSDVSGPAVINVRFKMSDTSGGDGATKSVMIDGVEVWSRNAAGDDPTLHEENINVDLEIGTLVDFLLYPNTHDAQDTCNFWVTILAP
jgi:hypothetical protein